MHKTLNKSTAFRKFWIAFSSCLVLALSFGMPAALAVARGYTTDDKGLQTGMVAALSTGSSDSTKVERATPESSQRVVGIVTTSDASLVTQASGSTKVLVEGEGEVKAYVSNSNGDVKKGDLLVVSPLKGILMKVGDDSATIVGIATADFSSVPAEAYNGSEQQDAKNTQIARLGVNLNRQGGKSNGKPTADSSLTRLGRSIVGKDVGEIRVAIAMVIFIVTLITEGSVLYGSLSSAFIALGRNPLARKFIRRELFKVAVIAGFVLLVGLGGVYIILWI